MSTTTRSGTKYAYLSLLFTAVLAGCGSSESETTKTGPTPTSPTVIGQPATLRNVPVYWIADGGRAAMLVREFRDVPDAGGPVASAVAAMTRLTPLDPDYSNPWRPATRVAVTRASDAITVDLSRDALANTQIGSELAARAVQQLVYTATAAAAQFGAPATTVRITVDGEEADAWGAVRLGEPTARAPLLDVQLRAWVTSPREGAVVPAGTVRFEGFGTSFEATFLWKILSSTGAIVERGSAMGGTGDGQFGSFTFTAQLPAGTYSVLVSEDDPSDGESGHPPATDTKTFTVQ
jgi:hypothetical protein